MKRPEKEQVIGELTNLYKGADAIILTEYRGLSVPQISDLRDKLGTDTSYVVAKNTLARIAAHESGIEGLDEEIKGPSAVVFIRGDYVQGARTLREFAKENKALIVKGGYLEGSVLTADEVKKLADMKTREAALAELAGAMKGAMAKAAGTFKALPGKAARTFAALEQKKAA